MSLEKILEHIIGRANTEAKAILEQAHSAAQELLQRAAREAESVYQELLEQELSFARAEKARAVVRARLDARKRVLEAKHGAIEEAFSRLKDQLDKKALLKEQVTPDKVRELPLDPALYLEDARLAHEAEVARILFG
jgi:vacuolar-type H+-ATPase subunit E/Vma4